MNIAEGHIGWLEFVLLECGLDPDRSVEIGEMRGESQRTAAEISRSLPFARSNVESDEALVEINLSQVGPNADAAYVRARSDSREVIDRLRAYFALYALAPDGSCPGHAQSKAESQRDRLRLLEELKAVGPPLANDRSLRTIDSAQAELLIRYYRTVPSTRLAVLFDLQAPKTRKPVKQKLASFLVEEFARFEHRRYRGQIALALCDLMHPTAAPAVAALVRDRRLGRGRGPLCIALVAGKHPEAAEILVSLLDDTIAAAALEALAKMGREAAAHAPSVRAMVASSDPYVRRQAKRALKRMGVEAAPVVAHLVESATTLPAGYGEFSTSLDMSELEETLAIITPLVEDGFGPTERAEVFAVADEMTIDQTRELLFPIRYAAQPAQLSIGLFLDDNQAPDLRFAAPPKLIEQISAALRARCHSRARPRYAY